MYTEKRLQTNQRLLHYTKSQDLFINAKIKQFTIIIYSAAFVHKQVHTHHCGVISSYPSRTQYWGTATTTNCAMIWKSIQYGESSRQGPLLCMMSLQLSVFSFQLWMDVTKNCLKRRWNKRPPTDLIKTESTCAQYCSVTQSLSIKQL